MSTPSVPLLRCRRVPLSLALALILAACATAPPDVVRVEPPARFKEGAHAVEAPVAEAWWEVFGDPVLDDLERQLLIGNESLKTASAQLASARAAVRQSQAALWPTLSVGATGGPGNSGGSVAISATATWEADLWGRLSQAEHAAVANATASQADLAAVRLSSQAALVQSYLALRSAEAQAALARRTAAADQRTLEITQARRAAGVVAESDVLQAESQLRSVQAQEKESVLQRAQLEHAIAVLLGRPPESLSLVPTGALPEMPAVPGLLPSTLLERRPDIASAERKWAAALAQVGAADAAWFPVLGLSANGGVKGSSVAQLFESAHPLWSLVPSLAEAIFDGGARQLASDQARASAEVAASTYRATVLAALQEVEDNLAAIDQLGAELLLQREALVDAERSLAIVREQYRAGTVSFLNVAAAQTSVLSAEGNVLTLRNRQLAAANVLLKNIGGRWQPG